MVNSNDESLDRSQLVKGVLDLAVLSALSQEDGYGYDVVRRLRSAGLVDVAEASVYGTLRRDCGNDLHRLIARNSDYIGMATYQGQMYQVADYPGIIPSSDAKDQVVGELYLLSNTIKLLNVLDEYEEFDSEDLTASLFVREKVDVNLKGKIISSYAYLYNRPVNSLKRITSGDFLKG